MNISFLTTDEPLFLPKFFEHALPALSRRHAVRVYSVPPALRKPKLGAGGASVCASFGVTATIQLTTACLRQAGQTVD